MTVKQVQICFLLMVVLQVHSKVFFSHNFTANPPCPSSSTSSTLHCAFCQDGDCSKPKNTKYCSVCSNKSEESQRSFCYVRHFHLQRGDRVTKGCLENFVVPNSTTKAIGDDGKYVSFNIQNAMQRDVPVLTDKLFLCRNRKEVNKPEEICNHQKFAEND